VDLSYHKYNLPHLVTCLSTNGNPSFLYNGDSFGGYTFIWLYDWLMNNTSNGVQEGANLGGYDEAFYQWTSTQSYILTNSWLTPQFILPGTNGVYSYEGGLSGRVGGYPGYVPANLFQWFFYGGPTNGSATIYLSSNGVNWLSYTINEASFSAGLHCTNIALPNTCLWTTAISNVSGAFVFPFNSPALINTNNGSGATIMDISHGGFTMDILLSSSTSNDIKCIVTNINPTVVINEQTKPVASYLSNYDNYFTSWFSQTNLDNILIPGCISSNSGSFVDPPGSAIESLCMRMFAIKYGATFVDFYSAANNRAILDNAGMTIAPPHLSGTGQLYNGIVLGDTIPFQNIYDSCGQWNPPRFTSLGKYILLNNGTGNNLSLTGTFHWNDVTYTCASLDVLQAGGFTTIYAGNCPGVNNSTNFLIYVSPFGSGNQAQFNGTSSINFSVGNVTGLFGYGHGLSQPGWETGGFLGDPGAGNWVFRQSGVRIAGTLNVTNAITASGGVVGNVTGNVSGSAASFTGSLSGNVTGTQGATVISSVPLGALPAVVNMPFLPFPMTETVFGGSLSTVTPQPGGASNTLCTEPLVVSWPTLVTNAVMYVSTGSNSGHLAVGIYDYTGNKLLDTGPVTTSTGNSAYSLLMTNGTTTGYTLPPGTYHVAWVVDNTQVTMWTESPTGEQYYMLSNPGMVLEGTSSTVPTLAVLPQSIGTLTAVSPAHVPIIWFQ
jgi:hypothetical protein